MEGRYNLSSFHKQSIVTPQIILLVGLNMFIDMVDLVVYPPMGPILENQSQTSKNHIPLCGNPAYSQNFS
jgi:hypothetical protein